MKNKNRLFTGIRHPEDIRVLRKDVPAFNSAFFTSEEIQKLYSLFSEEQYAAGWMGLSPDIVEEFAAWLEEEV